MPQAPKCRYCNERHWNPVCPKLNTDGLAGPASTADAQRADTKPAPKSPAMAKVSTISEPSPLSPTNPPRLEAATRKDAGAAAPKPKRGRPAAGFDKKAYDREAAKARRAAKKEQPK